MIDSLKELGNTEFRCKKYRQAIQLYTQALDSVDSATVTIPIETRRILLANRAQAFIFYGIIHEALRDLNHALSPQYTRQDSSKTLTAKCRYRRAKLLCTMARYHEAQADYSEFAKVMGEIGTEISGEELKLKEDLDCRAAAGDDTGRRRRDELMRAIDTRGFILRQDHRATFPLPPQEVQERLGPDFYPESMTISFDTLDSKPDRNLPDPNLTPISIPVTIRAPYFYPNPHSQAPFSTREEEPVSEHETIGSLIENLFTSTAAFYHNPNKESMHSAVAHERDGVVIMMSYRGRLFKIPRKTTIKDVVAGARWPRQPNAPTFEDLRRAPRKRSDEIDGIELSMGWMIEIYIVTKDKLASFLDRLESGFPEFGI